MKLNGAFNASAVLCSFSRMERSVCLLFVVYVTEMNFQYVYCSMFLDGAFEFHLSYVILYLVHLTGRKLSVSDKKQTTFRVPVPGHVVPDDHG